MATRCVFVVFFGEDWSTMYVEAKGNLSVLPTVEAAIDWANALIVKIDKG